LVDADPDIPGSGEGRWAISKDVNIEHLLNISTSFGVFLSLWAVIDLLIWKTLNVAHHLPPVFLSCPSVHSWERHKRGCFE
jgi:hypothetical protein